MTPRAAMKKAEQDPRQLVDQLTQIVVRLDEVLVSETDVLKNHKPGKVVDFHEEKARLTNEFALQVNFLKNDPHLIDRAPAEQVNKLKSAMATLHERSDQNGRLLTAAKSVSDGFVKTVANVAAQKRAPQTGYGQSGAMTSTPHSSAPLSLDARF
jgi:dynactin complex subunit